MQGRTVLGEGCRQVSGLMRPTFASSDGRAENQSAVRATAEVVLKAAALASGGGRCLSTANPPIRKAGSSLTRARGLLLALPAITPAASSRGGV